MLYVGIVQIENVDLIPPNHIKFDFLGKDSIRYENTVDVEPKVFRNVEQFSRVNAMGKGMGNDMDTVVRVCCQFIVGCGFKEQHPACCM